MRKGVVLPRDHCAAALQMHQGAKPRGAPWKPSCNFQRPHSGPEAADYVAQTVSS